MNPSDRMEKNREKQIPETENGMEETILVCENSIEGVLTAVYRAYEWKLDPYRTRIQIGQADLCLFVSYREVQGDRGLSEKVIATVRRRFGEDAWEKISHALAAEDRDKGQAVYRTIAAGLSGQIKGPLMEGLADDYIRKVFELSRRVHNEAHRMKQFLRFKEVEGDILYAQINPGEDVTALIMPHFSDRFPLENFMIADMGRGITGIHAAGKEWFLIRMDEGMREQFEALSRQKTAQEREMVELFRHFCHTIGVRERKNTKLQQQFLPLKYRAFMTEFNGKMWGL